MERFAQFGDYTAMVRPATTEEIESWKATAQQMNWFIPETFETARFGCFVSPTGNVMDLPYELRSTVMRVNGGDAGTLDILAVHFYELCERVEMDITHAVLANI